MRVLITGGLGYLGGRIARHFVEQGDYVIATTRQKNTPIPEWLKNKGEILGFAVESPNLGSLAQVDCVIHLAALNEIDCANSPEQAIQVNTVGTLRLMECLAKGPRPKKFIYFSTAHVYAAPLIGCISEATIPRPIHPYAYSHRAAEDLVFAYQGKAFERGVVIRLSNGFGYPERAEVNRWTLLVNDLCQQIAKNGNLKLLSDGTQQRDFIPLEDVARATRHLALLDAKGLGNGVFNVGSGYSMSVFEMATRVHQCASKLLGRTLPAIERPSPIEGRPIVELNFAVDKLKSSGFEFTADWDFEITQTLKVCIDAVQTGKL